MSTDPVKTAFWFAALAFSALCWVAVGFAVTVLLFSG